MQKLAEICIRRPVFASMIVLTLVVVGAAGYLNLDVDRFPSVDLPTVRVFTRLPGASPEETESQIAQPIEEVINTIEGIKELRSISGSGSSFTVVTLTRLPSPSPTRTSRRSCLWRLPATARAVS